MIKVVPKIMMMLEMFADGREHSFAAVAERMQLTRSNTAHLLKALCDNEILVKVAYGKYRRGRRLTDLCVGSDLRQRLVSMAERCVDNVAEQIHELVVVGLRERDRRLTIVKRYPGKNHMAELKNGSHHLADWYGTANGRILLAYAPDETVEQIVRRHGLPKRLVWREASSLPRLKQQLSSIRKQGYVIMDVDREIRAIGLPVRDASGENLLSLATAFPVSRHEDGGKEILEQLRFHAENFEKELVLGDIRTADLNKKSKRKT